MGNCTVESTTTDVCVWGGEYVNVHAGGIAIASVHYQERIKKKKKPQHDGISILIERKTKQGCFTSTQAFLVTTTV